MGALIELDASQIGTTGEAMLQIVGAAVVLGRCTTPIVSSTQFFCTHPPAASSFLIRSSSEERGMKFMVGPVPTSLMGYVYVYVYVCVCVCVIMKLRSPIRYIHAQSRHMDSALLRLCVSALTQPSDNDNVYVNRESFSLTDTLAAQL